MEAVEEENAQGEKKDETEERVEENIHSVSFLKSLDAAVYR